MIKACIQSLKFQNCIIAVIVFNAVILGIDTIDMAPRFKQILHMLDAACLVIYVTEIILKLSVYKLYFFKKRLEYLRLYHRRSLSCAKY